jgi:hypothetical protein
MAEFTYALTEFKEQGTEEIKGREGSEKGRHM